MKNLIVIIFCLSVTYSLAQNKRVQNMPKYDKKRLHFGFTIGLNSMDFLIRNSDEFLLDNGDDGFIIDKVYGIENTSNVGFHLGPIANLRLGEYFDLRALIDISFGQRNLNYKLSQDTANGRSPFYIHTMLIESIFVEFPILIKYKGQRLNNVRPYVIAGVAPKMDMAATKEIKDEEMPKIRLKQFDVYGEIGAGIDFYLPYFKLSTEIKFSMGLRDVTNRDNTQYTDAMRSLNSKMWVFSLHFE